MSQKGRMGHHAVVRPDGRAVDVPRPVKYFNRFRETKAMDVQGVPEPGGLQDARCIRHDNPSGQEGSGGMGNHLPGFRKVEHHPV